MNWNKSLRQFHRWCSIAFAIGVIANIAALMRQEQAMWVGVLALVPLALLLLTGLYLFVLPYVGKWRGPARRFSAANQANVSGR